jgi:hypothetical protein
MRSSGSCDRTATTRIGRPAAKPSRRRALSRAASSQSELIASSTRAGSAIVVWAGPYLSTTAATAIARRSTSSWSSAPTGPGRSSHTVPIFSSSRVTAAVVDTGCSGPVASPPSGDMRRARSVACSRIPATHSARPAEARASAGRSTRRRISVSKNVTTRSAPSASESNRDSRATNASMPGGYAPIVGQSPDITRRMSAEPRLPTDDHWDMILDPELDAFLALFPRADLTDPSSSARISPNWPRRYLSPTSRASTSKTARCPPSPRCRCASIAHIRHRVRSCGCTAADT